MIDTQERDNFLTPKRNQYRKYDLSRIAELASKLVEKMLAGDGLPPVRDCKGHV